MHVLILEDNHHLCNLYAKILTYHKYQVETTDTCTKALAMLATTTFDLVLVDMELPDGSGLMIIDYMRHNARFDNTKIVAITGDEKYEKAGNFRADFFLLKPVSTQLLYALVERVASTNSTPRSKPMGGVISSYRA